MNPDWGGYIFFYFRKKKILSKKKAKKREKLSPHQASDGSVVGSKISWFMFIGILCIFFIYIWISLRFKLLARKKMEKSFSYSLLSFDFQSEEKKTSSDYFLWCFFLLSMTWIFKKQKKKVSLFFISIPFPASVFWIFFYGWRHRQWCLLKFKNVCNEKNQ